MGALCWPLQFGEIEVAIQSPTGESAVFDQVEIVAEVWAAEAIDRVEFVVDGSRVATVSDPPYTVPVDVGGENTGHLFSVIAWGRSGSMGVATVATPAVKIDLVVDLPLQQLYITATSEGLPVLDLEQQDFTIIDDGQEEDLVTFTRGEVPMTIALLIDMSQSMKGQRLQAALRAAEGFMTRMEQLDEVLVLVFSDRVHRVTASSTEMAALGAVLENLEVGGGTALNDYLYAAVRMLDRRHGRPVVILLSDGVDTVSFLSMRDVLWKTQRSNVMIYRIQAEDLAVSTGAFATSWQDLSSSRIELEGLEQAVEDTGGRVELLTGSAGLEEALDNILLELRQQYAIGYYPSNPRHDGRWRPVNVSVSRPEVVLRTRAGYIDN